MKMAVQEAPKTPSEALLKDLYNTTFEREKKFSKSDEEARRIAEKTVKAFKNAWTYFATEGSKT